MAGDILENISVSYLNKKCISEISWVGQFSKVFAMVLSHVTLVINPHYFFQSGEDDRVALVSAETRDVEVGTSMSTLPPEWLVKCINNMVLDMQLVILLKPGVCWRTHGFVELLLLAKLVCMFVHVCVCYHEFHL